MSVFDVDYIRTVWRLLIPPDKRLPKWLAWGAAVLSGKQWKHKMLFTGYMNGVEHFSPMPLDWRHGFFYAPGSYVIYRIKYDGGYYGDNAVYMALAEVPVGTPPIGSNLVPDVPPAWVVDGATALQWLQTGNQTHPYYWVKVQDNFVGANERASYSCEKLIFEYALNRWFKTMFRQPNGIPEDPFGNPSGTSDIYISVNSNTANQFFWGQTRSDYYFAPAVNFSDHTIPISTYFSPGNSFQLLSDYTIYMPLAVYNQLSPLSGNRDDVVRAFVDLINPAGSKYDIATY